MADDRRICRCGHRFSRGGKETTVLTTKIHSTDTTVLSAAEKTTAIAEVRYLEGQLFDDDGHVRRRTDRATADRTVTRINELRRALGWLEVDLDGRWRWPA
jgi:hypothetical protein